MLAAPSVDLDLVEEVMQFQMIRWASSQHAYPWGDPKGELAGERGRRPRWHVPNPVRRRRTGQRAGIPRFRRLECYRFPPLPGRPHNPANPDTGRSGAGPVGYAPKLSEILSDRRPDRKVAMMFVDSAFGAPYVERLRAMGFENVREVNFGAPSPDRHQANMRAYMWHRMKEWLLKGAIPSDVTLEADLTGPGYHLNRSEQLVLEAKPAGSWMS
jgi:hypothetical protein